MPRSACISAAGFWRAEPPPSAGADSPSPPGSHWPMMPVQGAASAKLEYLISIFDSVVRTSVLKYLGYKCAAELSKIVAFPVPAILRFHSLAVMVANTCKALFSCRSGRY
jgi:hypothetical protein